MIANQKEYKTAGDGTAVSQINLYQSRGHYLPQTLAPRYYIRQTRWPVQAMKHIQKVRLFCCWSMTNIMVLEQLS